MVSQDQGPAAGESPGPRDEAGETPGSAAADGRPPGSGAPAQARLVRLLGIQLLVALAALSLFAAADSWNTVSGLAMAGSLCFITGILAGVTLTTLGHEWFHFLGALLAKGQYRIAARTGLFLYDWDYTGNSLRQFFIMSIAGSVGGALAVILLWNGVPADSWGRAALHGAALGSFVYAACVEWPVLLRTRRSRDPLVELMKIDRDLLWRSCLTASAAGLVTTLVLVP